MIPDNMVKNLAINIFSFSHFSPSLFYLFFRTFLSFYTFLDSFLFPKQPLLSCLSFLIPPNILFL